MNPIEKLIALEEIKQLKAKYFLGIDNKDWELWRHEVWAPDARIEVPELNSNVSPREALIAWVAEQSAGQVSVHHGHTPIIEFASDTTATGIWAMEDLVWFSKENLLNGDISFVHGWGHYRETYVKLAEGWRIHSTLLTRLRTVYEKVF